MRRVYLDHNATTPLRPEALEAVERALREDFGNPSSIHFAGVAARDVVERARLAVAALAGAPPATVVFTSSATEASNTVIRSVLDGAGRGGGTRLVTCATEHPSVLESCEQAGAFGHEVVVLPVDSDGMLDPERFERAIEGGAVLASIMWVNNETGVIHPIEELARRARAHGVLFHTDAVQALGKLPLDVARAGVDFASFSAHKLGGPKGAGALYARAGRRLLPLLRGGPQEARRRAGTENVPGIAGFGAACAAAALDLEPRAERLGRLRDELWRAIEAKIPGASRNGSTEARVSHVLNVSFPAAPADALVAALDLEGIAVAAGAACASGSPEPSHVLRAMGIPRDRSRSAIRVSLGFDTQEDDVGRLIDVLPRVVERVRRAERP
jgi:cysteine desulfurase